MKPILMIHEFSPVMLDLPLEEYTLTFDDGLYTQYMYIERLIEIETDKIFFISTGIVAEETTVQSDKLVHCALAHSKSKHFGDLSHYMNWKQIKEIDQLSRCEIGGHSHLHARVNIKTIIPDTKLMKHSFKAHGLDPKSFCFPYNQENEIYKQILIRDGYENFYGEERIDIYDIM